MEKIKDIKVEEVFANLDAVKPIETSGVDLKKYDKKETIIENAYVTKVNSQFSKVGWAWVLKVESVPLETLEKDGQKITFRCSELFNLVQNDDGALIGFPTGEGSNLMKFLKDIGVLNAQSFGSLRPLIEAVKGKKVLIKAYEKDFEGGKRTYLKFRY